MNLKFKRFPSQSVDPNPDDDNGGGGGGGDDSLGEKGKAAIDRMKAKLAATTKEINEYKTKFASLGDLDPVKVQEALEFQANAAKLQAEQEKNTEEARKQERLEADARFKKLQIERDGAVDRANKADAEKLENKIDAAIEKAALSVGLQNDSDAETVAWYVKKNKSIVYLTKADDGVDRDGVYVVDATGVPMVDPDDRNKDYAIAKWMSEKLAKEKPSWFKPQNATGDNLRGGRGRRESQTDMIDRASKMNPEERAKMGRTKV